MKPHPTEKTNPKTSRTCTSTYRINLPWDKPPLTENQRLHRMAEATLIDNVRVTTGWLIKAARIPRSDHCAVTLYWAPKKDHRERDAENPVPTLKAICDGIVDAGIVPTDTPEYMTKEMPVILPSAQAGGMWLEITVDGHHA